MSGKRNARSRVADAIARIEADGHGAVVTVSSHALADAGRIDAGRAPGALAGMPFTVKDVIATGGVRTTAGSRAFTDHVPDRDATAVARLRGAGAVLVGKTNCSELALSAWTGNPLFPETRNPRHDGRSPGGSSGGCAAAVAAGLVPISLGTDYGGSIRFPAACCDVVGLRPTPGRIPSDGQVPTPDPESPRARFSVIGPIGRSVAEVRAATEVLAVDTRLTRVPTRAIALADGPARGAVERASRALAEAGLAVEWATMSWLREAADTFTALRRLDTYDDLRPFAHALGTALQRLIAEAPTTTDLERSLALEHRRGTLFERALDALDDQAVLVLPIAEGPIPPVTGRAPDLESLWPARAISLLGLPAVAVANVQLVGPSGGDEAVLATAALVESACRPGV